VVSSTLERGIIITDLEAVVNWAKCKEEYLVHGKCPLDIIAVIIFINNMKNTQNKTTFEMSPGKINLYLKVKRLSINIFQFRRKSLSLRERQSVVGKNLSNNVIDGEHFSKLKNY
jgi:hypothetical protein